MLEAVEESEERRVKVDKVADEEFAERQSALGAVDPDGPGFEEELRRFVNFHAERAPDYVTTDELISAMQELVFEVYKAEGKPITDVETRQRVEDLIGEQLTAADLGLGHSNLEPELESVETGADPVTLFSGEFVHEANDFTINGAGIDFTFSRLYKNQASYRGPLGHNWDHSYNLWLRVSGTTIFRATGRLTEEAYSRHPKSGEAGFDYWVPPNGQMGVIVEDGESFVWREPNGRRFVYEPNPVDLPIHRIARIEDRFGNRIDFQYDEDNLVRVIVNHSERIIRFEYDDQQRIVGLRDHTNRLWRYVYDDFGDLASVVTPATEEHPSGLLTCYEYSSESYAGLLAHNLTRIVDAAGQAFLEIDYGTGEGLTSFNRVVAQREGCGVTLFEYEDVIEENDFSYADHHRPTQQTIVTSRSGQPVLHVFNRFGNLLYQEECVVHLGEVHSLRWRYRYNEDGQLTAALTPEGSLTQYLYRRDEFMRENGLGAGDDVSAHDELTMEVRQGFGQLLAVVRRAKLIDAQDVDLAQGVWGDIFPGVFAQLEPEDVVVKSTYEPVYGQLLTTSDPRFTTTADPNGAEPPDFDRTLTRFFYRGPAGDPALLLDRISYPTPTLPDGSPGDSVEERYPEHDERGRPMRYINTAGTETRYEYFAASDGILEGLLRRVVIDPDGLAITTEATPDGLGRTIETILPRSFEMGAMPLVQRNVFNELDQLVATISPAPFEFQTRYAYDKTGNPVRIEKDARDHNGEELPGGRLVETFLYDQERNLVRRSVGGANESQHLVTRHLYDCASKRVATILPRGNEKHFHYDARQQLIGQTRGLGTPDESTSRQGFDDAGRLSWIIDGRGFATTFAYDAFHNVVAVTDALGNVSRRSYDKMQNMVLERLFQRQADGSYILLQRRQFDYDELGRRIRSSQSRFEEPALAADPETDFLDPLGAWGLVGTQTFYDSGGRVVRIVDSLARASLSEHDALDRPTRFTDAMGNRIENRFDAHGNLVRQDEINPVRDPGSGEVLSEQVFSSTSTFDELDRLVSSVDSLGNATAFRYDSLNNLVRKTDPLGNVVELGHDQYGRLAVETLRQTSTGLGDGDALEPFETRYGYDANGNLRSVTDPLNRQRRWTFDPLDRMNAVIYADGRSIRYRYDARDALAATIDINGVERHYRCDALGRVTDVEVDRSGLAAGLSVEGSQVEHFEYDAMDRRLVAANDFARCAFRFDSLGLPIEETQDVTVPEGTGPALLGVARSFDDAGRLAELTYPGGRVLSFSRDSLNRVSRIDNLSRGAGYPGRPLSPDQHRIAGLEYAGKALQAIRNGNDTSATFNHDGSGRIIEIVHRAGDEELLRLQYLYDAVGNVRLRHDFDSASQERRTFGYDSTYRLADIATADDATAFDAGDFAPLDLPADPIPDRQSGIDAAIGSLALGAGERTFDYDNVGNRQVERPPGQTPTTYSVNDLDQYTDVGGASLEYDGNGNLISDGSRSYFYDSRNLLVRVADSSTGQDIVRFFHDALGRRVLESTPSRTRRLVHNAGNVIAEYEGDTPLVQYVYGAGAHRPIQIAAEQSEHWYHADLTGSTRLLTNADAQETARHGYTPFGRLNQPVAVSATFNRLLFGSRRLDPALGQYDHRARQYDPALGRFLQRDPAGISDGTNLYAYVGNNPLSFVDPLGTSRQERTEGFEPPRLITTGRGSGGRGPVTYATDQDEEIRFVTPGQRGILAIDVDPEREARLSAQSLRRAIAQRRAFDNIDRDVKRAMNQGALWFGVWAGSLAVAPFVIEGLIVAAPWAASGGSLTTRLYLGGSAAFTHLGAGVSTFAQGSTLAALSVVGVESLLGIGGWRTQANFRKWSIQSENRAIDIRQTQAASGHHPNVRMPPHINPATGQPEGSRIPIRGVNKNIGAQRVVLDDGDVVMDEMIVTKRNQPTTQHNEQLGIAEIDVKGVDPKRVREIWIYTEKAPCLDCETAIQALETRFPNANVRVANTYGKVSWNEHAIVRDP